MQAIRHDTARLDEFKECLTLVQECTEYLKHLIEEEELPKSWEDLQDNQSILNEYTEFTELAKRLMKIYRTA